MSRAYPKEGRQQEAQFFLHRRSWPRPGETRAVQVRTVGWVRTPGAARRWLAEVPTDNPFVEWYVQGVFPGQVTIMFARPEELTQSERYVVAQLLREGKIRFKPWRKP